jgi:hypothetical protein
VDRIYPIELEIKDTTDTDRCASYLDLHLEIDCERRLRTKLYVKRCDSGTLNYRIVLASFRFSCESLVWSLPHTNKGTSRREEEFVLIMYADCLLKNTSTKENKYVVNQKLVHVDDISFRPWPTPRNWLWEAVKNQTLRQKMWFQFSHCELSIYM